MSNCPYPAKPCGRLSLRSYAQELRTKLGLNNTQYIDIVRLMEFVFPQIFPNFHSPWHMSLGIISFTGPFQRVWLEVPALIMFQATAIQSGRLQLLLVSS